MSITLNHTEDACMALAQPAHGRNTNPRFWQLLAALDEGWQIAPPVYRRPRWLDANELVYHFILVHPHQSGTRLITVADGDEVRDIVRDRNLPTC